MNDSDILGVYPKEDRSCYICHKPIKAGKVVELIFTTAHTVDNSFASVFDVAEDAIGGLVTNNNYAESALAHITCVRGKR